MKFTSLEAQIRRVMEAKIDRNTKAREKVVNVSREDDAAPTDEKSKLAKQAEIKTKIIDEDEVVDESILKMTNPKANDARKITGGTTDIDLNPKTDDRAEIEQQAKKKPVFKSNFNAPIKEAETHYGAVGTGLAHKENEAKRRRADLQTKSQTQSQMDKLKPKMEEEEMSDAVLSEKELAALEEIAASFSEGKKIKEGSNKPTVGNQAGEKGDQRGENPTNNTARYDISDDVEYVDEVLDTAQKRLNYGMKAAGSAIKSALTFDKNTQRKRMAGNKLYTKKVNDAGEKLKNDAAQSSYNNKKAGEVLKDMRNKSGYGAYYNKEEVEELDEKLVGGQKNLDKNHNGKIAAEEFELDEVSSDLAKRARHGALVKAYDYDNGTSSGKAASKIYKGQAKKFDKYARDKEAKELEAATKASLPMSKQRKIAAEEFELDEAHKVGDTVQIHLPGSAAHGQKGTIKKIEDGSATVAFDGGRTGVQTHMTLNGMFNGQRVKLPNGGKLLGGTHTIVPTGALKAVKEEFELDEVSSDLAKRARHGALVKAYDYDNGTSSGKAASKIYKKQAGVFDKYARDKEAKELEAATKASLPMSKQRKIAAEEKKPDIIRSRMYKEGTELTPLSSEQIERFNAIVEAEAAKRGKGRPKKNPEGDEPRPAGRDPRQHIQVIAGQAGAGRVIDFKHDDGSSTKITAPMGRSIVAHLNSLKPKERHDAVQSIHGSAGGLKSTMGIK